MAKKKVSKKVVKRIEKKNVKTGFWFDLSSKEKENIGKAAGETNAAIELDEKKFDDVKAEWKSVIKKKRASLGESLAILKRGQEYREVDAVQIKDFQKNEIRWMVGTKCMETKSMDVTDKQTSFPLGNKPTVKNKTKGTVVIKEAKEITTQVSPCK